MVAHTFNMTRPHMDHHLYRNESEEEEEEEGTTKKKSY